MKTKKQFTTTNIHIQMVHTMYCIYGYLQEKSHTSCHLVSKMSSLYSEARWVGGLSGRDSSDPWRNDAVLYIPIKDLGLCGRDWLTSHKTNNVCLRSLFGCSQHIQVYLVIRRSYKMMDRIYKKIVERLYFVRMKDSGATLKNDVFGCNLVLAAQTTPEVTKS